MFPASVLFFVGFFCFPGPTSTRASEEEGASEGWKLSKRVE